VRVQLEVEAAHTVFWGRVSYARDPDSRVSADKTARDVERELYAARVAASLDRLRKAVPGVRFSYVSQAERGGQTRRLHHHVLVCADGPVSQNAVKQAFSGKRKDRARKPDRYLSPKALSQRRARDKARAYLSSPHQLLRARIAGQCYWLTVKKAGVVSPARGDASRLARYLSKYLSKDMVLPTRRSAGFGSNVLRKSFAQGELGACIADMRLSGQVWFSHTVGDLQIPWYLLKPLVKAFERRRLLEADADLHGMSVDDWQAYCLSLRPPAPPAPPPVTGLLPGHEWPLLKWKPYVIGNAPQGGTKATDTGRMPVSVA